jgi:hypothetical protein
VKSRLSRIAVTAASALALLASTDLWAGRGHGGGTGGSTSARGHAGGARHHHHRPRVFVGGTFFLGAPFYPYYPYPYAYPYPYLGAAQGPAPTTYIEQYPGTPGPDTQDWIVCPSSGGTYPAVTECAGGWARVVENPAAPSAAVN